MMKSTIISIIIAGVVIIGATLIGGSKGNVNTKNVDELNNVSVVDGIQIIDLTARGGYSPMKSVAKADIPTILRINTKNTFDCSAAIRIPSMNISKFLPQTGVTEIDLNKPKKGTLDGSCGMGMYPFEIDFK